MVHVACTAREADAWAEALGSSAKAAADSSHEEHAAQAGADGFV